MILQLLAERQQPIDLGVSLGVDEQHAAPGPGLDHPIVGEDLAAFGRERRRHQALAVLPWAASLGGGINSTLTSRFGPPAFPVLLVCVSGGEFFLPPAPAATAML